jgi:NADP-dependent 3-hydroxy acid dehydrogenase YdfG
MTDFPYKTALIVGAGPGISASLARQLTARGVKVALAARDTDKLQALVAETGARAFATDASEAASVASLFEDVERANRRARCGHIQCQWPCARANRRA